ncbi:glutamate-5-semialdehyde dehydrogenase [Olivibacter sp. CPCC 100613]|uniref:glutamate-5-semialdehyde dehydrogenase n=1 Tax=Olivibacter sp. CPCC 100613 TaxID=3079931 RepID=UPI002FF9B9A8
MNYLQYFQDAKAAQQEMLRLSKEKIDLILTDLAIEIRNKALFILEANQKDLDRMSIDDPKYDRLQLSIDRIAAIASDIEHVVKLDSPVGKQLESRRLPNELHIEKISVPLGVVSVIYEARPNVTLDVFSLCFKTGNVTILKGGSDAMYSNEAIIKVIQNVLVQHQVSPKVVILLPAEREATEALLQAVGYIDVLIPRGSQQLINYVRSASKIPVIETGAGIVHTYFDLSADLDKGKAIIYNAKTRRVSVCNSLDCVLIHKGRLKDLPALLEPLSHQKVELFADEESYRQLADHYPQQLLHQAAESHFGIEFLSLKLAVKVVEDIDEAISHIARYSSKHSEAIVADNPQIITQFLNVVDAAAVYANASTAFTDGAQFGLGAEIGISTQKLHARGPMGLEELTSYKWIIRGDGQTRE